MKVLLAASVLGLVAGISGASVMLGWIWPGYGGGDIWFGSYYRPGINRAQMEERIREDMESRVVTVYRGSPATRGVSYLRPENRIGEAIIISSDGWIAVYFPSFDGKFSSLSALSRDGQLYGFEKGLIDPYTGIAYLKVQGAQFRVVSFNEDIKPNDSVSVFENGLWRPRSISGAVLGTYGAAHLDSAPMLAYSIDGGVSPSTVVVNTEGRIMGVTKGRNLMIPSEYITRVLPSVLGQGKIAYRTLGVEGWFSAEQPILVNRQKIEGFFINKVRDPKSLLRKDDIITHINGRVVDAAGLWYTNSEEKARLQILRQGRVVEAEARIDEQL